MIFTMNFVFANFNHKILLEYSYIYSTVKKNQINTKNTEKENRKQTWHRGHTNIVIKLSAQV